MINKIVMNCLFIVSIMFLINYVISLKYCNFNSQKPFECGFESNYWINSKLSIHFFKIGIIFILFDLELLILVLSFLENILLVFMILFFMFMSLWIELKSFGISWSL